MNLFNHYRNELNRIAWRMQYYERKERRKETLDVLDIVVPVEDFSNQSLDKIVIQQLLSQLSSEVGKEIINQIYIFGKTEKEASINLKISQQGAHKWKNKMLKELQTMSNYISYWQE